MSALATGWQIAGTVMAVWFAASALLAFGWAAVGRTRKPAPQPPLSDDAVDAIFDLMVQETQARDESNGGA